MERRDVVFLLVVYAGISFAANFPSGFTNSSVNTAIDALDAFIVKSAARRGYVLNGWLLSLFRSATLNVWWLGQVAGALLAPTILDFCGRRASFLFATWVSLAATGVQWLSIVLSCPELLLAGRVVSAAASPLSDACLILYIQETSPVSMRGAVSCLGEIGYGAMCVLGMVMGMRFALGGCLDRLLLAALPPQVFSLIVVYFLPESPKFLLITRNDRKAALLSLRFFQGDAVDHEEILDDMEHERDDDELSAHSSVHPTSSSFIEILWTWHLRRSLLVACSVIILTLSFYPMLQSSTFFFQQIRIPARIAEASSTFLMIIFTLSCIAGSTFIDRFPRRTLIILFGCLTNLFLLCFAVCCSLSHFDHRIAMAAVASLVAYSVCFGLVLGPIAWFIGPELVSQRHRATVWSLCFAIGNVLIASTNFAVIPLFRVVGGWAFVFLFVLPSMAALLVVWRALPESGGVQSYRVVAAICASRSHSQDDSTAPLLSPRY